MTHYYQLLNTCETPAVGGSASGVLATAAATAYVHCGETPEWDKWWKICGRVVTNGPLCDPRFGPAEWERGAPVMFHADQGKVSQIELKLSMRDRLNIWKW